MGTVDEFCENLPQLLYINDISQSPDYSSPHLSSELPIVMDPLTESAFKAFFTRIDGKPLHLSLKIHENMKVVVRAFSSNSYQSMLDF